MNLEKEVFELNINDIMPNRFQPREIFDEQALNELALSIKEHGVIQPIIVRKIGDKYEIIAGERRYRASQLAGKTTIPALVRDIDDKETAKIALLENLQRSDLTPIEEAKTYQTILKLDNITQEELADNLGKSQSTVANKLRLLNLEEEVQTALLNKQISERHARSLLNVPTAEDQKKLLNQVIMNRLTVRQLDEEIMALTGKQPQEEPIPEETTSEVVPPQPEPSPMFMLNINTTETQNEATSEPILNTQPVQQESTNLFEDIESNNINQSEIIATTEEPQVKRSNIFDMLRQESSEVTSEVVPPQPEPSPIPTVDINQIEETTSNIPQSESLNENTIAIPTASESVNESITPIEQPEQPNYNQVYDLRFAINNVRQAVQNTEKFGFNVDVQEFDLDNVYQIIIKIDKNKF